MRPLPPGHTTRALPHSVLEVTAHATRLQPLPPQKSLHLIVCLNFPHPGQIDAFDDAVSNPKSPLYRQFLTPQEVGDRFGPSQADYASVVSYLQSKGLTIAATPANRMTVSVTGTVAQAEAAFGVGMSLYRESRQIVSSGRVVWLRR